MDEIFDPQGNISHLCRPILREQKEKLIALLTDKKENGNNIAGKKSKSIEHAQVAITSVNSAS